MLQSEEIIDTLIETSRLAVRNFDHHSHEEVHDHSVVDIATAGDRQISKALHVQIRKIIPEAKILSEESGCTGDPESVITIAIDDLDGTDNFFRAPALLPWCTVITILQSRKPRFSDVVACGILDHHSGISWKAARGKGIRISGASGRPENILRKSRPSLDKRCLVLFDHYAAGSQTTRYSFLHDRYWVKDFGSSAIHLAMLASGMADAYVNVSHKAHELGAGYLLIREAGGIVTDFSGRDLGEKLYEFDQRYEVLAHFPGMQIDFPTLP